METSLHKKTMPETMYRASRYCRVLGNPTAYLILRSLQENRMTPSALSSQLGVGISTISITLRHLRQVNLVRYETRANTRQYWIKDPAVLQMLDAAESLATKMRHKTH